jgi:hypothetical protein
MAVPGTIAQRLFLLAWNPAKGRIGLGTNLGAMIRAGALADLYLSGHLADENGRAAIGVRRPCPDPVLDSMLDEIAGARPRKWQHWVSRRQRATVHAVRRQLGDDGWVRLEPYRILGLVPAVRVTMRDPRVRTTLVSRVKDTLHRPIDRVEEADAALVAILAAGGLSLVLDRQTRRDDKRRIQALTAMSGPIAPALKRAIEAAESAAVG